MNSFLPYLGWFSLALTMAWFLSVSLIRADRRHQPVSARSLHRHPIPTCGGLAIGLAFITTWSSALHGYGLEPDWWWFIPSLLLIAAISYWDDHHPLSPGLRLFVQAVAVLLFLFLSHAMGESILPPWGVALPAWMGDLFYFFFMVWMMNLYNFMDGLDGLAGGMGVIGFAALALIAVARGADSFAMTALLLAGANGGFLVVNFPPARLFMGDVGAVPMGFMAAVLAFWGESRHIIPLEVTLLIFLPFIADATITLLLRWGRGEKIWHAHCSHFYQQVVRAGWSQRKTVLWAYALMLLCALAALWGRV